MSKERVKVGINGYGRIGRCLHRQLLGNCDFEVVAINDLDPLVENHIYLLEFDSIYGRLENVDLRAMKDSVKINSTTVRFFSEKRMSDVPWHTCGVDIVIESSGSRLALDGASDIITADGVQRVFITNSSSGIEDATIVCGVNCDTAKCQDRLVSTSICDVNAIAPFLRAVESQFKILSGTLTTLHPWLQYQNLLDGSVASVSNSTHYWSDFSLGRASTMSLIPKETTVVSALHHVLPEISTKLTAMSFRTPVASGAAAQGTLLVDSELSYETLLDTILSYECQFPSVLRTESRQLVSIDFKKQEASCIVDSRWLKVAGDSLISFTLWYDNEWGYASSVIKVMDLYRNLKS